LVAHLGQDWSAHVSIDFTGIKGWSGTAQKIRVIQ